MIKPIDSFSFVSPESINESKWTQDNIDRVFDFSSLDSDPSGFADHFTGFNQNDYVDAAPPLSHSDQTVWIAGLGWVPTEGLSCLECGDEGRIVTGWEDSGDAESGPQAPTVSDWEYCTCAAGKAVEEKDADEQQAFFERFGHED